MLSGSIVHPGLFFPTTGGTPTSEPEIISCGNKSLFLISVKTYHTGGLRLKKSGWWVALAHARNRLLKKLRSC
jgi:hypothetical protein